MSASFVDVIQKFSQLLRIKLLHVIWVCLCISTVHVQWHKCTVLRMPVSELVSCAGNEFRCYKNIVHLCHHHTMLSSGCVLKCGDTFMISLPAISPPMPMICVCYLRVFRMCIELLYNIYMCMQTNILIICHNIIIIIYHLHLQ